MPAGAHLLWTRLSMRSRWRGSSLPPRIENRPSASPLTEDDTKSPWCLLSPPLATKSSLTLRVSLACPPAAASLSKQVSLLLRGSALPPLDRSVRSCSRSLSCVLSYRPAGRSAVLSAVLSSRRPRSEAAPAAWRPREGGGSAANFWARSDMRSASVLRRSRPVRSLSLSDRPRSEALRPSSAGTASRLESHRPPSGLRTAALERSQSLPAEFASCRRQAQGQSVRFMR